MEIIRLGPTTLNLAYFIAAERSPDEPGTLLVECVTGTVRKVRGEHAAKLLRRLDELDPPPPSPSPGKRPSSPRVTVYEDMPPPAEVSRSRRGRRPG